MDFSTQRHGQPTNGIRIHTSWIAVGKDKLAILPLELIGGNNGLEEQRHQATIIPFRAVTNHDPIGEGNMCLELAAAVKFSIPAAWEHELQANTIRTVLIQVRLLRHEMTRQRGLWPVLCVIQAVEAQRPLLPKILRVIDPGSQRIWVRIWKRRVAIPIGSRNHLEPMRECLDLLRFTVRSHASVQEVVAVTVSLSSKTQPSSLK